MGLKRSKMGLFCVRAIFMYLNMGERSRLLKLKISDFSIFEPNFWVPKSLGRGLAQKVRNLKGLSMVTEAQGSEGSMLFVEDFAAVVDNSHAFGLIDVLINHRG